jgi:hypothetical protein
VATVDIFLTQAIPPALGATAEVKHGNNLDAVRELAVEQPIRKRRDTAAANRRFKDRPPLRMLANAFASFPNGVEKQSSQTWLSFIIKLCGLGQLDLGNAEIELAVSFHFPIRILQNICGLALGQLPSVISCAPIQCLALPRGLDFRRTFLGFEAEQQFLD